MKYAVVKIGGGQYRVQEGDELQVDKLSLKEGAEVEFPEVLLVAEDSQAKIGQPLVANIKVAAKVLTHLKGEKIRISRFRAKARYRKTKGFRASLTKIKIISISAEKTAPAKTRQKKTPVRKTKAA